jgi:5'/3'-nucleotidase SurE
MVPTSDGRVNVLVVNDDGITAPGLVTLVETLAATEKFDVYVAAPDSEKSACVLSPSSPSSSSIPTRPRRSSPIAD